MFFSLPLLPRGPRGDVTEDQVMEAGGFVGDSSHTQRLEPIRRREGPEAASQPPAPSDSQSQLIS